MLIKKFDSVANSHNYADTTSVSNSMLSILSNNYMIISETDNFNGETFYELIDQSAPEEEN